MTKSLARGVLVIAAILVPGCGNAATTTTTDDTAAAQSACSEESDPTDYTNDASIGARQAELEPDVETVRRYGEQHPDEFTSVAFDNHPEVRVVGYFTARLDEHRAALAPSLEHADRFEIRRGVRTARESDQLGKELASDPDLRGHFGSVSSGSATGVVRVNLHSDRGGRAAAEHVRSRWGDGVCVEIAKHPFPRGAWEDSSTCPAPIETLRKPAVDFHLVLSEPTRTRGVVGSGVARITNRGAAVVEGLTGTAIVAYVVQPGTSQPIGLQLVMGSSDAGRMFRAEPGETIEIPVSFGTDDCRPDHDYALPVGRYGVTAYLEELGRSDEASLTITDG